MKKANIWTNKEWRMDVTLINIVPYEGKFMVIFDGGFVHPEYAIVDLKDIETC